MTAALEGGEWSAARLGRTLLPGNTRTHFTGGSTTTTTSTTTITTTEKGKVIPLQARCGPEGG